MLEKLSLREQLLPNKPQSTKQTKTQLKSQPPKSFGCFFIQQQQPKKRKKRKGDSYPTNLSAATQFKTRSKQDVLEALNFCLLKEPFFC